MKKLSFRKIVSAMLVLAIFCTTIPVSAMASSPDDLVDVVVYQDNDRSITACVPRSDLAAFKEQLEDPAYRQEQIDKALAVLDPSNARVLPEGNILSQQYLGKDEIEEFVDAFSGAGTYRAILSAASSVTSSVIKKLVKASGVASAAKLAAKILSAGLSYMTAQQESWWTTSYIKILNGDIDYVRYTIIENPQDYPKIWRVLDRV